MVSIPMTNKCKCHAVQIPYFLAASSLSGRSDNQGHPSGILWKLEGVLTPDRVYLLQCESVIPDFWGEALC